MMTRRWRVAQALEIQWWQRYLAGKDPDDYLMKKRRYWRRILREAGFSINPGERVLDAGCGPAGIFLILEGREVTAVDPLLEAYETKLPHFSRSRYPEVNFKCLPLEQLRANQVFDKVCCLNVINHVADLPLSLDRLVESLRPGGALLLTVDVHRHPLVKFLFRRIPGDVLHPHQHSLADYLAMIEARGCKILRARLLKPGRIFDYYAIVAHKAEDQ